MAQTTWFVIALASACASRTGAVALDAGADAGAVALDAGADAGGLCGHEADGTPCAAGSVCSGGACQTGCFITGVVYTAGASNPDSACQTCDPGASTTDWTDLGNGASCGMNAVCKQGACAPANPFYAFPDYRNYYDRTFIAPIAIVAGDTISMPFPFANSRVLVDTAPGGGFLKDDGSDLRVVYDDGATIAEIGRNLVDFPGPSATIQFLAQTNHSAGTEVSSYKLILGNANAGAPPTITATTIRAVSPSDTPKVNEATPDAETLADSRTGTLDDYRALYGANQTAGAEYGFSWTATVTDRISRVEIPLQQSSSPYLQAYDAHLLVYTDDLGAPGTLLARAVASTFTVEKETGSWVFQPFHFDRTFLRVSAGSTYHFVVRVFGAGSAIKNIKLGLATVASGGNLIGRTRTASAWDPWVATVTSTVPFRIFSGTCGITPTVAIATIQNGQAIMLPTQPWENTDPTRTHLQISEVWKESGEWRAFFDDYTTWSNTYGGEEKIGTATSPDGLTWVKGANNPVLSMINLTVTDSTKNMWMYDETPGALRAYFQSRYHDTGANPIHRHIRHAHNNSTWDTSWTDDGEVTYPWPSFGNIQTPQVRSMGGDRYVYFNGLLNDSDSWTIQKQFRAQPDTTLTLKHLQEIRIDWSDNLSDGGWFSAAVSMLQHEGAWYGLLTREVPAPGGYYFTISLARSLDGLHFSTPVPMPEFAPTGDSSSLEYRGTGYPVATEDGQTLVYFSCKAYELTSSGDIYNVPSRRDIIWPVSAAGH